MDEESDESTWSVHFSLPQFVLPEVTFPDALRLLVPDSSERSLRSIRIDRRYVWLALVLLAALSIGQLVV